ncbi:MAG: PepSY domain-containing protein [Euryarchaeota archaeon]|nr:PepSY domain-containing protein [Euryarchaeota archaeon]
MMRGGYGSQPYVNQYSTIQLSPYGYGPSYGMGPWMMGSGAYRGQCWRFGIGPWTSGFFGQSYWNQFNTTKGPTGYGQVGRGFGCPMWGGYSPYGQQQTTDVNKAKEIAENYLKANSNLKIDEIIEFIAQFEVEVKEKDTGMHAFEFLVDKYTGNIIPEMGPNMMWNTKYGHMAYGYNVPMSIAGNQAMEILENFIKQNNLGISVGDPEVYYGFYEFHGKKDGKTVAQINVNGYTGQILFENWHGQVLNVFEFEEEE